MLPLIQNGLEPYEVRPHWGKVFTIAPEIMQARYSNLAKFKQAVERNNKGFLSIVALFDMGMVKKPQTNIESKMVLCLVRKSSHAMNVF